uniref:Uncharacterized protein n=1 Tax=Arundo donax TaxID=35708 RepID=A0A0A8ZCL1_ARUDO
MEPEYIFDASYSYLTQWEIFGTHALEQYRWIQWIGWPTLEL